MTATIDLSLDVPQTYNVDLLKQQLTEYANQLIALMRAERHLQSYTLEELHSRVAESEAQYAAGEYYTQDEAHRMMDEFVQELDK